jgi:hypothetical protein
MTTPSEHADPLTPSDPAGTDLLPAEARETVQEIKAENAALKAASRIAEASAEAVVEQARQLAEVTEEVLQELKEGTAAADGT